MTFTTGHLRDNTINLNWPALVQQNHTLVFYMGLTGLPIICQKLIEHGMSKQMPIALVQAATRENQEVVTGTLENIVDNPNTALLKPPTLIIVGTVVSLHASLNWFSRGNVSQ